MQRQWNHRDTSSSNSDEDLHFMSKVNSIMDYDLSQQTSYSHQSLEFNNNSLDTISFDFEDNLTDANSLMDVPRYAGGEPHAEAFAYPQHNGLYTPFDYFNEVGRGDPGSFTLNLIPFEDDHHILYSEDHADIPIPLPLPFPPAYPSMSQFGTVFIVLRHWIRIDISPDKAVYVTNNPGYCAAVLNDNGKKSSIVHPNGRILQDGSTIEMRSGARLAKICRRGVLFTSDEKQLSFLVDASGTKSTTERYLDLTSWDWMTHMFYSSKTHRRDVNLVETCHDMIMESAHRSYDNGDEAWLIGGVRIKQNLWGEVRVTTDFGSRVVRTSPTIGSIAVTTPYAHMRVNCEPYRNFVVKSGEAEIETGRQGMIVKNGSQKAGLNRRNQLVLF